MFIKVCYTILINIFFIQYNCVTGRRTRVPKYDIEFFKNENAVGDKPRIVEFNGKELEGEECREFFDLEHQTHLSEKLECHEILVRSCFRGYKTVFKPKKLLKCEDHFKKDCYINYKSKIFNQPIRTCRELPEKDCDTKGPVVCVPSHETVCETYYGDDTDTSELLDGEDRMNCMTEAEKICENGDVKRRRNCVRRICEPGKSTERSSNPSTRCYKISKNICGPEECSIVFKNKCEDSKKSVLQDFPHETCDLVPKRICTNITKLIPSLESKKKCMKVPKEICSFVQEPKRILNTTIKKICKKTSGPWTPFADWSPCSVSCGNGTQERRRRCLIKGKCVGFDSQTRKCSMPSCERRVAFLLSSARSAKKKFPSFI